MMQTIAQINNVTHRYKGAAENSLDGVSLTKKSVLFGRYRRRDSFRS